MTQQRPVRPIKVLVADDTRVHTQLLGEALSRDAELEVSIAVGSADLIEELGRNPVDVALISANLEDEPLRGCQILRQLRGANKFKAVVLLDSSKQEVILQAFRAGARGLFSRHESIESLSKCIRSVHQGQIWANSQQMSYAVEALAAIPEVCVVDAKGLDLLSKRELEVVRCLAEGLSNRDIATRLGLSEHTIKNYLFRVFDKLGVSSRLELLFMTLSPSSQSDLGTAGERERAPRRRASREREAAPSIEHRSVEVGNEGD